MEKKKSKGFTLIELVVVVISMVVIAFAIYATLSSGLKIWQKVSREASQEDVNIFFEKFTQDLHNGIIYKGIDFSGAEDNFELPTLVMSRRLKARSVGKTKYVYDKDKGVIRRYLFDFSYLYDSEGIEAQELLRGVKSLKFQYYIYDAGGKTYLWQDEWAGGQMPLAVRVELEAGGDGKIVRFARTVGIPVGN